jgi:DsbC/DsbD-like thiol-disulfide interchange protein
MIKTAALSLLFAALSQSALAAQSAWVENEGGAMRLVLSGDGSASTRGVLEIKLNPGWKTYWREPGDGGVPPSLTGDGLAVELLYPAPERFSENGLVFNGYHTSVSLPFILPETLVPVDQVTAFIGVCSEICVPFQAEFPLVVDGNDAEAVNRAFAQLPKPGPDSVAGFDPMKSNNRFSLSTPDAVNSTLFLAPQRGIYLAMPEATASGFDVEILQMKADKVVVEYTLNTPNGAISGKVLISK